MRALAALRMVWASAAWMAVEMLATWCKIHKAPRSPEGRLLRCPLPSVNTILLMYPVKASPDKLPRMCFLWMKLR